MFRTLNISLVFLFSILISISASFGQKNSILLTGNVGLFGGGSLSYEKELSENKTKSRKSLLKLSLGLNSTLLYTGDDLRDYTITSVNSVQLFGKRASKFEMGFGVALLMSTNQSNGRKSLDPTLSALIGYRLEKRHFLFRIGLSFPEGIYLGGGYRF